MAPPPAKALLDRGARILAADINEEAGEELASGARDGVPSSSVRTSPTREASKQPSPPREAPSAG